MCWNSATVSLTGGVFLANAASLSPSLRVAVPVLSKKSDAGLGRLNTNGVVGGDRESGRNCSPASLALLLSTSIPSLASRLLSRVTLGTMLGGATMSFVLGC